MHFEIPHFSYFPPDINECLLGEANCHSDAICTNFGGSFNCVCKHGYEGNGTHCEG